ncbi:MAG TPA: hypothetical protein VIK75_04880 [Calditerricola sp.]
MDDKRKPDSLQASDVDHEGRDRYFLDVDRMINEGLGGGMVSSHGGRIEDSRLLQDEDPPTLNGEAIKPGDTTAPTRPQ